MTIKLHELVVSGPGKKAATLKLSGKSHLVFGPTDTGKSYIAECIDYCLGGGEKPKDVGYSQGYTRAALLISLADNRQFTFFRDLFDGAELVYTGFHTAPPQNGQAALEERISDLLPIWSGSAGMQILIKAGKRGNVTAGDLRRVSIFDEIKTLNNVPFEGKKTDVNTTRNKSALALILRGTDDSEMLLPASTNERNVAKGHVEAIKEQITSLLRDIPKGLTLLDAQDGLARVSSEIEDINTYMKVHTAEITELKQARLEIENQTQQFSRQFSALKEAKNRFQMLDLKYVSDQQRLIAMATAASVAHNFEARPCPLCRTDIQHQLQHMQTDDHVQMLRVAAKAEVEKIGGLRDGLSGAFSDVQEDLQEVSELLRNLKREGYENDKKQHEILNLRHIDTNDGLAALSERKTVLALALNNLTRADTLTIRLAEMKEKSKRKKQVVQRNMSNSATELCARIQILLKDWQVPAVESVYFDDSTSDIEINQRKRTSYGKGKRGIFLTAYMVALMERALGDKHPHLGIAIIDSPVVTYKDPKHAKESDDEDLLTENVKDRFYAWLATRSEPGQVIILENEEPTAQTASKLNYTEFFGAGSADGRPGFFPA